ncbi:MAG: hypothetical protein H6Q02_684, partial [Acidobacteria bacterium]|nr:hypothetical protein [Acidobacteriota bacterium]
VFAVLALVAVAGVAALWLWLNGSGIPIQTIVAGS